MTNGDKILRKKATKRLKLRNMEEWLPMFV